MARVGEGLAKVGPTEPDDPEALATCTICLDTEGEVVQRGCCCRGDAGFVHTECLIAVAVHGETSRGSTSGWGICGVCKSRFTGKVLLTLAEERAARSESLDPDDQERLDALSTLSCAYDEVGRWAEATELDLQVLEARRRLNGNEHHSTLLAANNLAYGYGRLGR